MNIHGTMIHNESEYQEALSRLEDERKRIEEYGCYLAEKGLSVRPIFSSLKMSRGTIG